jgi:hypothetical protein
MPRLLAALIILLAPWWQVGTRLASPLPGQALQGTVPIRVEGLTDPDANIEVAFRYAASAEPAAWFLIIQGKAGADGLAAEWDTTTITDGTYTLRVVIRHADGASETLQAEGVRVRNYTPIETDTPTPQPSPTRTTTPDRPATQTLAALKLTATLETPLPPTATATPTVTPAPPPPPITNPAALSPYEVGLTFGRGVLAVIGLFAFGMLFAILRLRLVQARRARF